MCHNRCTNETQNLPSPKAIVNNNKSPAIHVSTGTPTLMTFFCLGSFCFHSSNSHVFFSFIIVILQYSRKYIYTTSLLYYLHLFVQPWYVRINYQLRVVLSASHTGQRKHFLFLIPFIILLPTNNNYKRIPRETFTMVDQNCDVHQLSSASWMILKILCYIEYNNIIRILATPVNIFLLEVVSTGLCRLHKS